MKTIYHIVICTFFICLIALVAAYFWLLIMEPPPPPVEPSEILGFKPVYEDSDPNDIRIAQAELCRHGIDVKIDSEYGKETAFGLCELLVKIQNGYKINSIYERK